MSSSLPHRIGIIAEDDSDVESARVLIRRISKRDDIGVKRFVGQGCGRINRKCQSWASTLRLKGCRHLIIIHDLDRKHLAALRYQLEQAIYPSPITPYLICIPIEEMEAWWLSDPEAIRKALNLRVTPRVKGRPQDILSPKEHIGQLVRVCSQKTKKYLNTEHNAKIAEHVSLTKLRTCTSFIPFQAFVSDYFVAAKKECQAQPSAAPLPSAPRTGPTEGAR